MAGSRQSLRVVPDESFGSLLRRRRRTDDLTQKELGNKLGVSQQTIGAWERGERPQSGKLEVIAKYLRMDKQRLASLIDYQAGRPSGMADVSEAAQAPADPGVTQESTDAEATREPTDAGVTQEPADSEAAEESADSEAAEESADSDDAMMRRLAKRFLEAEKKAPLSPQRAEAYRALFEYFGRSK